MTEPCTQSEMIKEIRGDVKNLLAFKNKLVGIQIATSSIMTGIIIFIAWVIGLVVK